MLDFDISKLFPVTADLGPIVIFAVLGLVTLYGRAGVNGVWQLVSSMLTGLIIGGAFMIAVMGTPADFSGWFAVAMAGILLGLIASGVYETGKTMAGKIVERTLGMTKPDSRG